MSFSSNANAAGSTLRMEGGMVGGGAGRVNFFNDATAGQATRTGTAGVVGAAGGGIVFHQTSDGGTACAILEGDGDRSAGLDIRQLTDAGMGIGSAEKGRAAIVEIRAASAGGCVERRVAAIRTVGQRGSVHDGGRRRSRRRTESGGAGTGGNGNDVVITSLGIPEPGVLGLLATGVLFVVRRRR